MQSSDRLPAAPAALPTEVLPTEAPPAFQGYRRADGTVGVRNHVVVLSTVVCANTVAERIAQQVPGTVSLTHPHGCGHVGADFDLVLDTLVRLGSHPNVAATLVVGLGCERFRPQELAEGIAEGIEDFSRHTVLMEAIKK